MFFPGNIYLRAALSLPPTTTGNCLVIIRRILLVLLIFLIQSLPCHCIQSASTQQNPFVFTSHHKSFADTNPELANSLTHSLSRSGAEKYHALSQGPGKFDDRPFRACTAKIQPKGPTGSFTAAYRDANRHEHQGKPGKRAVVNCKAKQLG